MTRSGVLYPSRGFKEHCRVQPLFFYLCNQISMSREGHATSLGPGMDKMKSRGPADPLMTNNNENKTCVIESHQVTEGLLVTTAI